VPFSVNEIIGEGTFGKVKVAIHLLNNEKVAIKIFDKGKIKAKKEKIY
jgi:serine/threonine protein kinase